MIVLNSKVIKILENIELSINFGKVDVFGIPRVLKNNPKYRLFFIQKKFKNNTFTRFTRFSRFCGTTL